MAAHSSQAGYQSEIPPMRLIKALAFAALGIACTHVNATPAATGDSETPRLNQWLDAQYAIEERFSPLTLTYYGSRELYDQVDDESVEAQLQRMDWMQRSAGEMQAKFDYARLGQQGQVSYDFWLFRARSQESLRPFILYPYVFDQYHEAQSVPVEYLTNYHVVDTPADMQAYISRISGFGRSLDQNLQRARKAAAAGIRPPRFAYRYTIEQCRKFISGYPFEDSQQPSTLWADAIAKIDALQQAGLVDAQAATRLRDATRDALVDKLMPAYQRIIDWEREDIGNTPEQAQGVWALPNGKAWYQRQLRYYTHSDMSADEIHKLGLAEVARIKGEMEAIRRTLGFEGSLQELFAFVRESPRFYYPNTDAGREAYLARTRQYLQRIEEKLPEFFGVLPKSKLVVKRVEPFREIPGAAQFYQDGTADGSRPGVYYVHMSDMGALNTTDMESTTYHEGNPGHHLQGAIALEMAGVPKFRTQEGYSAYYEGWALYAEFLAKEMGAYKDPYDDFGRLVAEIWRAIRMVVDTGLHAEGWSQEQAVQYMLANSAIPEAAVRSEIERYLLAPGQAVSYKTGMLHIQALRAEAEKRLGANFDIRGFHDAVLDSGSVPLPILDRVVHDWIDQQTAAAQRAGG